MTIVCVLGMLWSTFVGLLVSIWPTFAGMFGGAWLTWQLARRDDHERRKAYRDLLRLEICTNVERAEKLLEMVTDALTYRDLMQSAPILKMFMWVEWATERWSDPLASAALRSPNERKAIANWYNSVWHASKGIHLLAANVDILGHHGCHDTLENLEQLLREISKPPIEW